MLVCLVVESLTGVTSAGVVALPVGLDAAGELDLPTGVTSRAGVASSGVIDSVMGLDTAGGLDSATGAASSTRTASTTPVVPMRRGSAASRGFRQSFLTSSSRSGGGDGTATGMGSRAGSELVSGLMSGLMSGVGSVGKGTEGVQVQVQAQLPYHVLVVDDSVMTRRMLRKTLQAAGCSCEEAEDGLQALQRVQQALATAGAGTGAGLGFDAILMDFVMVGSWLVAVVVCCALSAV